MSERKDPMTTETALAKVLRERFEGVLKAGKHEEDGVACVLECVSVAKGLRWTDSPEVVGLPDLRGLNDAYQDDARRTAAMVPLAEALWDWKDWGAERTVRFVQAVVLREFREVFPVYLRALGHEKEAKECEAARTLEEAKVAAEKIALALALARDLALALALARARALDRALVLARALDRDLALDASLDLICAIWTEEAIRSAETNAPPPADEGGG